MSTIRRLLIASLLVGAAHPPASAFDRENFDYRRFSSDAGAINSAQTQDFQPADRTSKQFELGSNGIVVASSAPKNDTIGMNYFSSPTDVGLDGPATGRASAAKTDDRTNLVRSTVDPCDASPNTPEEIVALVNQVASRHTIDAGLALAITWTESRFDRVRNSPKGARGPMQLMPGTAARFGVTDACDPASNIDGGIRYLRVLLDQFQNPILAIAAYNAGEQAIYDHGGVPPYPETVRYVASVINRQLGIDLKDKRRGQGSKAIQPDNPPSTSSVMGARAVTFVGGVLNF